MQLYMDQNIQLYVDQTISKYNNEMQEKIEERCSGALQFSGAS